MLRGGLRVWDMGAVSYPKYLGGRDGLMGR